MEDYEKFRKRKTRDPDQMGENREQRELVAIQNQEIMRHDEKKKTVLCGIDRVSRLMG